MLALDRADDSGKGTPSDLLRLTGLKPLAADPGGAALPHHRDLAISGRDLLELGLPQGPELGRILRTLLEEVGDGRLPNTPEVLLRRAEVLHQRHNANRRKS